MEHSIPLISTLAAAFGVALIFGFIAERIKVPALVGYLIAGIVIGPGTPGFVADVHLASQLSEIGVMLLMFGVGLHFSLKDLFAVKRIALPGAVVQMGIATLLGMAVALYWDWSWGEGLVFGLSLSCASTVVLLKALESRGVLDSMNGRIAVGWLVVEDLATVFVLVLLTPLAGLLGGAVTAESSVQPLWMMVGQTLLQVTAFIAIMLIAGRRLLPWLLWHISRTGSRELFTLSVVAAAIGIAYGAAILFNVSFALGAFFAGMVMRESEFSHRAAEESLPLRDAFSVLFFVSVGMLFEPGILVTEPLKVLAVVAIIMLGKALAALSIVLLFRYPLNTALTVSVSLAQIGEFSFILAGLGLSLGLLPQEGMSLVLAGAIFSIALNPLLFGAIAPVRQWALKRSSLARRLEQRTDPYAELPTSTDRKYLAGHVVLVGYGRVGQRIANALTARGIPYVVAEQNRELVDNLRKKRMAAVSGPAAAPAVLLQARSEERSGGKGGSAECRS
ncbi:MAG: cation:proton antiporter, partial [Fluviibacter sp.]